MFFPFRDATRPAFAPSSMARGDGRTRHPPSSIPPPSRRIGRVAKPSAALTGAGGGARLMTGRRFVPTPTGTRFHRGRITPFGSRLDDDPQRIGLPSRQSELRIYHVWNRRCIVPRSRSTRGPVRPRGHGPGDRPPGAGRGGVLARAGSRSRTPSPGHHRPGGGPATARQRGRLHPGRLQRRDLQLPGTDDLARIAGAPLRDAQRYRGSRPPV